MEFIAHRINTVEELLKVPHEFGVELDLRDRGDRLILQHDPFSDGEDFEEYLKHYQHGTMILNVKSERIEWRVLELVHKYNIEKYFFLDNTLPMIVQLIRKEEHNIALRFSEYEAMDTILNFQGKAGWVWVDSFEDISLNRDNYQTLKNAGYNLCLVSPELQGRPEDIEVFKKHYDENSIKFDAVCTKLYNIPLWK